MTEALHKLAVGTLREGRIQTLPAAGEKNIGNCTYFPSQRFKTALFFQFISFFTTS